MLYYLDSYRTHVISGLLILISVGLVVLFFTRKGAPVTFPATVTATTTAIVTPTPSPTNTQEFRSPIATPTPSKVPEVTTKPPITSTPTPTSTNVLSPTNTSSSDDILGKITGAVFVREGPGVEYLKVSVLREGFTVNILGTNASQSWFKVGGSNIITGWVSARYVDTTVDPGDLKILPPPPLPLTEVIPISKQSVIPKKIDRGVQGKFGELEPGTEHWFIFSVDQQRDTFVILMFDPNENHNSGGDFIGYNVWFALYTDEVINDQSPENTGGLEHLQFGLGMEPENDIDGNGGTGELTWNGPLTDGSIFYLRVVNASNKMVKYCLATINTNKWTCNDA